MDGALNVPDAEVRDRSPVPVPERPGWQGVASTLIHDALNEAMMRGIAREEEIARTAILLGVGYARIQTWVPLAFDSDSISVANQMRVDYVVTSLVPPMERFEFPSWSSFEAWRARLERLRG